MGYYTYFELNFIEAASGKIFPMNQEDLLSEEFAKVLGEINPNYFENCENLNHCFEEELKWYDHDDDMIALSKKYPEIIFILDGKGEDHDDVWRTYYRDGRMETCNAHFVYDKPISEFGKLAEGYNN